jgi:hypothetical protein
MKSKLCVDELYVNLHPEVFAALPPTVTEPLNTALPAPLIDATFAGDEAFLVNIHPRVPESFIVK